jgi:hypothetical protein
VEIEQQQRYIPNRTTTKQQHRTTKEIEQQQKQNKYVVGTM